jgi:hypothetical protein
MNRFDVVQVNRLAARLAAIRRACGHHLAASDRLVDSTADPPVARVRGLRANFYARALAPKAGR